MPHDPTPMELYPYLKVMASPTALMYINLIVAGVLLLEALLYAALLRRRRGQREVVPLSLGMGALLGLVALAASQQYASVGRISGAIVALRAMAGAADQVEWSLYTRGDCYRARGARRAALRRGL